MLAEQPDFPPLLTNHPVPRGNTPRDRALDALEAGTGAAGDFHWSAENRWLSFAVILEPDVPRARCYEMLPLLMVAFGDAAGALIPPEVSVTYSWPDRLLVNSGEVGRAGVHLPLSSGTDTAPDWMVLTLDVELKPETVDPNPGQTYHKTTLWEEGCGEISRVMWLNSVARHFLTWVNNWEDEGFKPVHDQFTGRLEDQKAQSIPYDGDLAEGDILGLDESGNLLLRNGDKTRILLIEQALAAGEFRV